ncbi:MAG: acyl-CoA thioesterase [Nannocystaceae bacterium]|nr:acyl-CoA thioesterase [Nannocystaceae bacterium]
MVKPARLCPEPVSELTTVATARVLFADTDKMGIVYHASYLRYLEMARVEFIRKTGSAYTELEDLGFGLPVSELAVRYHAPGLYDDRMTLQVGLSRVTAVRVNFEYRVCVLAGDRRGLEQDVELVSAQTRHACVRARDGRPQPLPDRFYDLLRSRVTSQ